MSSLVFDKLISYKHMTHKTGEELLTSKLASPYIYNYNQSLNVITHHCKDESHRMYWFWLGER